MSLDQLREDILQDVIKPVLGERWLTEETRVLINHAGSFILGGPAADTGLTGRKIIVDTYGGNCPHGSGAFSGKDATKVDRSAAYASRWVARHLVDSGLARRATVQVSYAIGSLQPISILVNTNGTGVYSDEVLADAVTKTFDLSPKGIIERSQPATATLPADGRLRSLWPSTGRLRLGSHLTRRHFAQNANSSHQRSLILQTVQKFTRKRSDKFYPIKIPPPNPI